MSNRLNQEREQKLQPQRMSTAEQAIQMLNLPIIYKDETKIVFGYRDNLITFYPYSGWHTGKGIKDGRGLQNLLKQLL